MIESLAQISALETDGVRVISRSQTGCAQCDAGKGCGGGVLGKLVKRQHDGLVLSQSEFADLRPGETVVIGLDDGVLARLTLWTYVLPLLALAMFGGLGALISEPASVLAGLAGLALAMWQLPRLQAAYVANRARPRILRRAQMQELGGCGTTQ